MDKSGMSKASLARAFDLITPAAYLKAARNPAAFQILSSIEKRSEELRQRVIAHAERFQDRWTAKEAMRLWERHTRLVAGHPSPDGARPITPEALMKNAARNVQARTNARLSKVNDIQTRMGNMVARNLDEVSLRQRFNHASPDKSPARMPRRTP